MSIKPEYAQNVQWGSFGQVENKRYTCGYCGESIASNKGFVGTIKLDRREFPAGVIYICHYCSCPTYFRELNNVEHQVPGPSPGTSVKNLPALVGDLYQEARDCMKVGAYTASVLTSRKLLMHIAVENDAPEGASFASYVEFIAEHLLGPRQRSWIDHIRTQGNQANHEVKLMGKEEAMQLIDFLEMLLKLIYEYPARISPPGPVTP